MSLYKELKKFQNKDKVSFHIPGHKFGHGLSRDFKKNAFLIDVTEFDETDDLQHPEGILKSAQERAAKVYGAGKTFYLTNGSSIGLHAAILGSFKSGGKILVDRTCHKAVASALVMAGLIPVFIYPDFDEEKGLYTGLTTKIVSEAVRENPDIMGAVITSPTYYGICSDVKGIADYLHKNNKILIVDEAHGAHFPFHKFLPESAIELGADVSVQSAHKTLPAMGQSSFLHVNKNSVVKGEDISKSLRLLQTTSPSYLLMASMDEATAYMSRNGKIRLGHTIKRIAELKSAVRAKGVLDFADSDTLSRPQDILRLSVDFKKSGISGEKAAELLKNGFGIYPEMADSRYVVFVVTTANTNKDIKLLKEALLSFSKGESILNKPQSLPRISMAMEPRLAWQSETEAVPLLNAAGRISADILAVCPPGAALLVAGQLIDNETVRYIESRGITDSIQVVKE